MPNAKNFNVLVAEDDAIVSEGTARQLSRLGYTVAGCAYDGPHAVELTAEIHPGVILMDLQMIDPDTGREDPLAGLKATRLIQERCPAAVVVLSAHESPDLSRQASEAGAIGYVVKPAGDLDLDRAITIGQARFKDLVALRQLTALLELRNEKLLATVTDANSLRGLVTICAHCKQIRDDHGAWQVVERYIEARSSAKFSHGICPKCATELYPDIFPDASKH
jgi:AmiR/NasT family two-component response regulator